MPIVKKFMYGPKTLRKLLKFCIGLTPILRKIFINFELCLTLNKI